MSVDYEIVLLDSRGNRLPQSLTAFNSLEYVRKVNDVGSLTLVLPARYPLSWFSRDYRLEVWRSIDNRPAYCEGETQWMIRKIRRTTEGGELVLTVTAYDLNTLLNRRIVAYDAETVYTSKADFADDMMKEIMSENFGVGCIDGDRDISDWLDIQGSFGLAMPIEKGFARRIVLPLFQELAEASYQDGIFLAFDLVRKTSTTAAFKTWINQRGVDHTKAGPSPILFGEKYGNFSNTDYLDDATEEATFVYAGGQGEEASRIIQTAQDDDRIKISPFGRIEQWIDARQAKLAASVADEAKAELKKRRPLKRVSGKVVDKDSCRYGLHYKFGDRVTVETDNVSVPSFINSIHIAVRQTETIDIGLEAEWT